jgi:micrococcal nuclease
MSPSSAPANAGVVTSLNGFGTPAVPAAKSLGAFEAPTALPTGDKSVPVVKPSTASVSVDVATGAVKPSEKQIEIPKVEWSKPVTVSQAAGDAGKIPGHRSVVTFVGDGDSVFTKNKDGSSLECRIDSIDAPEVAHPKYGKPAQAFGEASKKTLQDMVLNREVTVRVSKPAKEGENYGRALCQIEIEGQNIDKKMLQEGMAWLNKKYNTPELASALNDAKTNKRGLWSDPNPINPAAFRYGKY